MNRSQYGWLNLIIHLSKMTTRKIVRTIWMNSVRIVFACTNGYIFEVCARSGVKERIGVWGLEKALDCLNFANDWLSVVILKNDHKLDFEWDWESRIDKFSFESQQQKNKWNYYMCRYEQRINWRETVHLLLVWAREPFSMWNLFVFIFFIF